jgi:hypothetical protein
MPSPSLRPWHALPLLGLLLAAPASALPLGPAAAVGVVLTPTQTSSGGQFAIRPMVGPVAQAGFQLGDWLNSQFLVQFSSVSGEVQYNGLPLDGSAHVRTLGFGYQLTLDLFGKEGLAGFSPYFGGGLLIGSAHVEVDASSSDPGIEQQLRAQSLDQQQRDAILLELHAVVGVRYRVMGGLGVRAEVGLSTYGGFLGTWEPKLGVEYAF